MAGLSNSRHAPWRPTNGSRSATLTPPPLTITPAPTGTDKPDRNNGSPNSQHVVAAHELNRYTKIVRRLKWKLPFLAMAYHQAVDRIGRDPADVAEAELMFKLDFFEYYMLLERALVHLLGVFGITISRGADTTPSTRRGDIETADNGLSSSVWKQYLSPNTKKSGDHRYHANVLDSLDARDNPLHDVLGTGEVRRQLGRAKDLRNRWKTAAEDNDSDGRRSPGPNKLAAPLETYDLETILTTVFDGFDAAFLVAERFVRGDAGGGWMGINTDGNGNRSGMGVGVIDWAASEEEQWEFMVDAMDWEAV